MSTVATILSKKGHAVASVSENDFVLDAAKLMREKHIGSVIVVRADTVAGIFTERDTLYRVIADGKDPAVTRVSEVMTAPVTTVSPETTLLDCAQMMTSRRMRHIPVIENGKLAGIVTAGDIMAYRISHLEESNI